jgi:uncharacterized protein DUF4326
MCNVLNARKVGKCSSATLLYIGRPSKWGNPFVIGRARAPTSLRNIVRGSSRSPSG